jgi:HSP20 family protein
MLKDLIPAVRRPLSRSGNDPFVSLRRAMDRVFDDFNTDVFETAPDTWRESMRSFTPRLDMEDREDSIVLSAELPGMTDKDVQVELNKDFLTIKGEKKSERKESNDNRYFSERSFGSFERTVRLTNEINRDKIEAAVKHGVLTVTLPKSAESKKEVKKIPVHH